MVSIIVATDRNNGIGKDNALLWHLPNDLKRFKSITSGHPIIMGRKTYDSIGRALPNRMNIVISNNKELKIDGCTIVHSLLEALELVKNEEVFIIGGGNIYKQAMELADKIYLTKVDITLEADTFFPYVDAAKWQVVHEEQHLRDEKHAYNYEFIDLIKKAE